MAEKKQKNWWWLLLLFLLLFLIFIKIKPPLDLSNEIIIRLYNKTGDLVSTSNLFTIVNDIPGITALDFTIEINNNGNVDFDACDITSLTPLSFDSSITKTTQTLAIGETKIWTSSRLNAQQFESLTQPVRFTAIIKCKYDTKEIDKTASVDITFREELADFTITIRYNPII